MPKTRRGGKGGTGGAGGGNPPSVDSTTSLISERERKQKEVDQTLTVLRDVEHDYDVILEDVQIAKMKPQYKNRVMAYYDYGGNFAVNENYFDSEKMDKAYDGCVAQGFHPPRGKKTGLEAVTAHELGHRLTDIAGQNAGYGRWAFGKIDNDIVRAAAKSLKMSHGDLRAAISGYAQQNNAECIAEAYADVYCNGRRAKKASKAVVAELNKYFYQGPPKPPKGRSKK